MKVLRVPVMLALLFLVSSPLFAAPPVQQEDSSTLYATNGYIVCSDVWGCPNCGASMDGSQSICVRIRYANGHCKCGSPRPPTETQAVCLLLTGSCRFLW